MLKLMSFPRGTNRNRTLKQKLLNLEEEIDSTEVVERIFRRFWRERMVLAGGRDAPFQAVGEEGDTACE